LCGERECVCLRKREREKKRERERACACVCMTCKNTFGIDFFSSSLQANFFSVSLLPPPQSFLCRRVIKKRKKIFRIKYKLGWNKTAKKNF